MIRLAIYYSPQPESPLAAAANTWLGRNIRGEAIARPTVLGLSEARLNEILSAPFHYAFHGTIKPPFRLAPGATIEEVARRLESFAAGWKQFLLPPLTLTSMHDFFCLRPAAPSPQLHTLAARATEDFDVFRHPPSKEELDKRRKVGLTALQEKMLLTWGYPYVMDEFRFHLTLTGNVVENREKEALHRELQERFPESILRDIPFSGLSLFIEMDGKPMLQKDYFAFSRL
jgi:Protein of unknown function (DUF1045)